MHVTAWVRLRGLEPATSHSSWPLSSWGWSCSIKFRIEVSLTFYNQTGAKTSEYNQSNQRLLDSSYSGGDADRLRSVLFPHPLVRQTPPSRARSIKNGAKLSPYYRFSYLSPSGSRSLITLQRVGVFVTAFVAAECYVNHALDQTFHCCGERERE